MSASVQVDIVISDQSYNHKLMISHVRHFIEAGTIGNLEQLIIAAVAKGRKPNMVVKEASTFFQLHTSRTAVGHDFFFLVRVNQQPIGIGTLNVTTYAKMVDVLTRTRQVAEAEQLKQQYQKHFDEHDDFNILEERAILIFDERFRGMSISSVTAMAFDHIARRLGCSVIVCDQAAKPGEGSQRWNNHSSKNDSKVVINLATGMGSWQVIELH